MRVWHALGHAFEGLASTLKHEAAFRQEVVLACVLVPLAVMLPISTLEKLLLIAGMGLVLVVELLNSALEWAVDYISPEPHAFAKRAKDMGSAAVFLSLMLSLLLWIITVLENGDAIRAWLPF